jgi:Glycosyl transferase family 2
MANKLIDTYFFLLENPGMRQVGLCDAEIHYCTKSFSKDVYEESRQRTFYSYREAYVDWQQHGRRLGLQYAPGKDTTLKIVLKVKDDPELLSVWIDYHATLVGYENLIILDTGSKDDRHLQLLSDYRYRVLILNYRRYYDHIHSTQSNRAFFDLLSRNCKYLTILDADEFLVAHVGGMLSKRHVIPILQSSSRSAYAATWLQNVSVPTQKCSEYPCFQEIAFSLDPLLLRNGTVAGKSIVHASIIFGVQHLGHNLHVKDVVKWLTPDSFGALLVFHLSYLDPLLTRQRLAKHLRSLGVLPVELYDDEEVGQLLARLIATEQMTPQARGYAHRYLDAYRPAAEPGKDSFRTSLLSADLSVETQPKLEAALAGIGFADLLFEYQRRFGLSPDEPTEN